MKATGNSARRVWITYGLGGFAIGVCLVSLSAVGLMAYESANPPPTLTPIPTPTVAAPALLDQAYQLLYVERNPQQVLDLLKPHLEEFTNPDELAKALEYLARAEMLLGRYQLSAAYFERLVQISPTPANYAELAAVYEAGGDLENALANYLILLELDKPSITEEERQLVQDRVTEIEAILSGFTPTPSP